jgi:hypothetical protein
MARVPGTYANEHRTYYLDLVENPDWSDELSAKARRGELEVVCHDRTPCIDVRCPHCNATAHLHLSQFESAPADEIATVCRVCGSHLIIGNRAFVVAAMREAHGMPSG